MKGLSLRKKLGIIFLSTLLMLVSLYSSSSNTKTASAETVSSGFEFENGSIIGYEGTATSLTIPATINGEKVKSIDNAFSYNETLRHVTISEGITSIANGAFFKCSNLESISIPASVSSITYGSLAAGEKLSSIDLDEANTSFVIVDNILYNSDQTEIIQNICATSASVPVIPETVVKINAFAFAFSSNLTSITIPETVENIEYGAFSYCSNLSSISVESGNTAYVSKNDVLLSKDEKTLLNYPAGKSNTSITTASISSKITTLESYSFSGCQNLNTLTISDSVNSILGAFEYCPSLVNVEASSGNSSFSSIDGVLTSKDKTTLVYYPAGRTASSYTVPDGITTIDSFTFCNQFNIDTVIMNEGVTTIGMAAFFRCMDLEKLVLPESVTEFGLFAFAEVDNMKIWGYPGSTAEEYAEFWDIPFVAIGSNSEWSYTDNGDGTCTITEYKGTATDVYVPSVMDDLWVYEIACGTFDGFSSIEYITFYESVNTIEASNNEGSEYIFEDCTSLREVYLPASLEKLQTYTAPYKPFKGCTSLVNVIVDEDNSSFYSKDGVLFSSTKTLLIYPSGRTSSSYTIPSNTTGISYTAFDNSYLKEVTVPGSISTLSEGDEKTFKNNIETVYIKDGVTTVEDVFSETSGMDIYFPSSVTSISGFIYADVPHTFYVYEDSAAHIYAEDNSIDYVLLCIVTFQTNEGSSTDAQVVPEGLKATEPDDVKREGYILLGWYTDESLKNEWSFKSDTVEGNMTLYAKWKEGYEIIYHMNGGVNDKDNPDYYIAGDTILLDDPTKDNYTFDGWYTNSSCALKYKFEAIESTTTGTIELWADWWVISAPDVDDDNDDGGADSRSVVDSALSDEREPEISFKSFTNDISYMHENQSITIKGKITIKYADVEEIAVTYSGNSTTLYKYEDGKNRLSSYSYSHTFDVGEINYSSSDKYLISVRLSGSEIYQYSIPIYKYELATEIVNAPYGMYLNSGKSYELRSMSIATNAFKVLEGTYENLTPEICEITDDNKIKPLSSGRAKIQTTIKLEDGSSVTYTSEFNVMEKTADEPSKLERQLMCQCYGKYCSGLPEDGIDPALLELILKIKEESGVTIYVISGYRCEDYNRILGGETDSEHVHGTAADIWTDEITLDELYDICDELNENGGVGKYETYIHIDTRGAYIRWED